uniref:Ig-like domain-containing protein n=1 Tax=Pygocentrus nattereri TaxID=42514 RepID=A0A3B4C4J5_PYGNA
MLSIQSVNCVVIDIFSITLPESVESVRVFMPCTFTLNSRFDTDLQGDPKGIWHKDGTKEYHTVFDSTTPENNKIKGKIREDLRMKNCTTIFNSVNEADSGRYYFKIEAGELRYTYRTASVSINVRGDLFCSAVSPCPTEPPTLTWSPLPTNSSQEQNQNIRFISSQLSFITTYLHHKLGFICTATCWRTMAPKKPSALLFYMFYAPRNMSVSVSPSGPVMWGRSMTLNCNSDGNPAVNYTWYKENGEQMETGPSLTITETNDTYSGLYYCRAQNQHGAQDSSVQLGIHCDYKVGIL